MMKSRKSKSKKKPKAEAKSDKERLSELDKTFYELQIADLTRKLTRVKNLSVDLEHRNEALNANNRHLDEDRADVIAYLRATVRNESDEIVDLLGRLEALSATRDADNESFQLQLAEKDGEYREMQTQLHSEIKLLEGKLNALEEFRLQRDELNEKLEEQEQRIGDEAHKHRGELCAIERKFIVDKGILAKQVEQKLRDLADEFQNATDMRIAESTQRMIRENIAVNNANVKLAQEAQELYKDREELQEKCKALRLQKDLASNQCQRAVSQCNVLKGIIAELTTRCYRLQSEAAGVKGIQSAIEEKERETRVLKNSIAEFERDGELLKSNLSESMGARKLLLSQLTDANGKCTLLTKTLFEAIFEMRQRFKRGQSNTRLESERAGEEQLLEHSQAIMNDLNDMFIAAIEAEGECKHGIVQFYQTGCAGFVPRKRSCAQLRGQP